MRGSANMLHDSPTHDWQAACRYLIQYLARRTTPPCWGRSGRSATSSHPLCCDCCAEYGGSWDCGSIGRIERRRRLGRAQRTENLAVTTGVVLGANAGRRCMAGQLARNTTNCDPSDCSLYPFQSIGIDARDAPKADNVA